MATERPETCPGCDAPITGSAKFCPECGVSFYGPAVSLIGSMLSSKYKIVEQIGEGSMGQIFLAEHVGLEKSVAVKVLHRDIELGVEASQRFRREGIAAGRIKHRNAIEVYDFDTTEDGLAYLAMEYVEGNDLRELLNEEGHLEFEDAQSIVLQVLAALRAAHDLGIVHRDIKPANIMVAAEGDRRRVKVLDFGLSKLVSRKIDASLTTIPGRIIGTPLYMAPEQSSGEEADARADLYAIGLIFYELLVGERPFKGKSLTELLYAQATQPVPRITEEGPDGDYPDHLDSFFEKALDRDRDERFQSAEEMADALLGDLEFDVREDERRAPRTHSDRTRRSSKSSGQKAPMGLIVGAVVATLLAAGALIVLLLGPGGDEGNGGVAPAPVPAAPSTARASSGLEDAVRVSQRPQSSLSTRELEYVKAIDDARTALRRGDEVAAESLVSKADSVRPKADPEMYFVRGLLRRSQGDLEVAIRDFKDAVKKDPGFEEAIVELAWTELETNAVESAAARFASISASGEFGASAAAGRGAVAAAGGNVEEAETLFTEAIQADSEIWRAQLGLARLEFARGDYSAAADRYLQATRYNSRASGALLGLGESYIGIGDAAEAIDNLEAAREALGDDVAVLRALGAAYLQNEDPQSAAEVLKVALAASANDPLLRDLMVSCDVQLEEYGTALRRLGKVDSEGSDAADRLSLKARLELMTDDLNGALETADILTRVRNGDRARGLYFTGLVRFRRSEYAESAAALRKSVEIDDRNGHAWLMLGVLGMDYLADGSRALEDLICASEVGGAIHPDLEDWIYELQEPEEGR